MGFPLNSLRIDYFSSIYKIPNSYTYLNTISFSLKNYHIYV